MKSVSKCAVLTITLAALAQPVLADTYLSCSTRKVVITSGPHGETSSTKKEDLAFQVDDAEETVKLLNNRPLTITHFDRSRISANRDGIFYEFNRQDGTLSYATSTMMDGVTATIVGSGRCKIAPEPSRL